MYAMPQDINIQPAQFQNFSQMPNLEEAYKQSLVELEKETYPVKFAKMKIGDDRGLFWMDWASRLVEDTKPSPEEKKENANGSR